MLGWAPGTGATGTAAHPFNFEINGVDRISRVDRTSIRIRLPGPGENGSMDVTLWDPTSTIDVVDWDHVQFIEHAATRPVTFGGFVQGVRTEAWTSGRGRTHKLKVAGYGILLDRRHIRVFDPFNGGTYSGAIASLLQLLIGNFGGVITAVAAGTPSVKETVLLNQSWRTGFAGATGLERTTLRGAIDEWTAIAGDARKTLADPAPSVYWVDSYARFHSMWIPDDQPDDSFEDFGTAVTDSSNAPQDESVMESDGSDYVTGVYVYDNPDELGNTFDTYTSIGGHPVAGDMDVGLTLPGHLDGLDATEAYGRHQLALRGGSRVAAYFSKTSQTPIDYRPGMGLLWSSAQHGLSSAKIRILSVDIAFRSHTSRTYRLGLGGRLRPSGARESGKYLRRPVR